ncbi:hypothetical protein AAVH_17515 [Aphelenchoides avenae]|nr:hypothetical protein AAVH_17515 [Aphelenchus avenae]
MTTRAMDSIDEISDKLEECKQAYSSLRLQARFEEEVGTYYAAMDIEELRRTENNLERRLIRAKELQTGFEAIGERLPAVYLARHRLKQQGKSMLSKLPGETVLDIVEFVDLDACMELCRGLFWLTFSGYGIVDH